MMGTPLKWHGGKHYLARRIIDLMTGHTHYVEPYAGGLSVLLTRDPEGVSEVANDINGELVNFWQVLRDPAWFSDFVRAAEATPFCEYVWHSASRMEPDGCTSPVTRALAFFVHCRQSLAGRMKAFTGITKTRTRRGMNNEVSAWLTAVEGLPAVHARLRRVLILNRPALEVIQSQDGPDTLMYLDPPYLSETRSAPDVYAHEMTAEQHADLLELVTTCKGKVMLSGYRSALYDSRLGQWNRHDFDIANHAAGGDSKRRMTECVWCNF